MVGPCQACTEWSSFAERKTGSELGRVGGAIRNKGVGAIEGKVPGSSESGGAAVKNLVDPRRHGGIGHCLKKHSPAGYRTHRQKNVWGGGSTLSPVLIGTLGGGPEETFPFRSFCMIQSAGGPIRKFGQGQAQIN